MKKLVVIPTYNESGNILPLTEAVHALDSQLHILFVDDSSPDGTGQVIQKLQETNKNVHLLTRKSKEGLGRAYVAGMKWGLAENYDCIAQMDADFSHRPSDLIRMLGEIANADFVVGSRWVSGGGAANWNFFRKLISLGGSLYARWVLDFPLRDWTGGFNIWKKSVLQTIDLESVQSQGYSFQIEMKYKALKKGFSVREFPIQFELRRHGQSKMSLMIFLEALVRVWKIRNSVKS